MGVKIAKPEHEVAFRDICALVNKHAADMTALELLAIAANMVGKIIALQDQRTTTPEMALKVVGENIELGNKQALHEVSRPKGSA